MTNISRNQSIDLIKIVAMIGVIGLHCHLFRSDTHFSTFVLTTLCSGFALPSFFMVSGFLMIERNVDYKYVTHKIIKIFRFVAEVLFLFWIFTGPWTLQGLYGQFKHFCYCFLQMGGYPVFWYFGSMCILYVMLPIINKLDKIHENFLIYFFVSLLILESLIFSLNIKMDFENKYIIQTFRIWNWLFYFSFGALCKRISAIDRFHVKFYFIFGAAALYFVLVSMINNSISNTDCYYCSLPCMAYTGIMFFFISNIKIKDNIFVQNLSNLFLPVYAFHLTVYQLYYRYVDTSSFNEFSPIFDFISVATITIIISYVIMRIPYVKKVFAL